MALRWGILSTGKISNDFVKAVQTYPKEKHRIIAVAARALNSAVEFADTHNIPKAYEGYKALGEDEEIDIVYIGTLNPQHLSVAKLMLDHGKHVLCEKPLTMNKKQTSELIEYAKQKKLFLMEAVWSRCFPIYEKIRQLIDIGAIGDVLQVTVDFGFALEHVDRVNVKELGGSATLDIGVYMLQFAQYVYKGLYPTSIVSTGHLNSHGTDDVACAILMYPEGKTAVLSCNARVTLSNTARIFGTKGKLEVPNFWSPTSLITPTGTLTFDLPASESTFNYHNSVGLAYEAEEVRKCIMQGLTESPKMTHQDSLQLAEFMDTIRKSIGSVFPEDSQ